MRPYHDLTEIGRARRLRALAGAALEDYDLEPARLRLITNETNGIFRLDTADGRKFVVRVGLGGHIGHSAGEVAAETGWLAALAAETDLTVPVPLPTRDGRLFVTVSVDGVPDPRNVVVFTWLAGMVLEERISGETMHAYGALSASLHEHGARHRPADPSALASYDEVIPFDEPLVLFEAGEDLMPPVRRRVFGGAVERVEAAIADLGASGEPMRVLHGDLHLWNVMVSRRGLAPFDFEDLMWGWPVQDVATSLWYLRHRPRYDEWGQIFRAGYESVRPWPERRAGELEAFLMGRYLVLANDLLITPEWLGLAPGYLAKYEERLRSLLGGPLSR